MNASKIIKILHIIDKLSMDGINPSSCTILIGEWIPRLESYGFKTNVLTLRNPDIAGKYLEERGIKVYYHGHGKISPKNMYGIMDLLDQEKPDIVHLHGYSAANFGRIATRKKRVKNIVHEHAILNVLPHQYLADYFLRNYTDSAIAVAESVKKFMIQGRSIPEGKIAVIPNGIKLEKFKKRNPDVIQEKRLELGIENGYRIIGTVGRLREEKGIEYFIRSIPYILKEFPKTFFIIAGDGPLKNELEKIILNLDIAERVRFLGFITDVPSILSILDINIIPSLSEGMPLSLIEGMAIGNAIVATTVGGMPEVGEDGKTVFFVPPKDPNAIADKACYLLKNGETCLKLSNNAMISSRRYSVEANADMLCKFYLEILKGR